MKIKLLSLILFVLAMTSCTMYYISPESLQSQLVYGTDKVNVVDKDGKKITRYPTIHTGIRITKKDSTKQTFYYITATVKDSTIFGSKSALFNIPIKPVKISDIKKIEIDGR